MRAFLWPLLCMLGLYQLSSIPGTPRPDPAGLAWSLSWLSSGLQNFLHIPAYGLLAWLWQRALVRLPLGRGPATITALGLTLGYGLFDEWHQSWVPGRYPSGADLMLDGVGALMGLTLGLIQSARTLRF
ncbi:VanZ family protein [Thiohalorhabdus sp. Cl-TMA]|uniref:VanZ family protein n=1 Tax=Thiohalorhabdus methylotrophus TaxID=3242694 RepID=A0ABV4TWQ8_9GAMM